MGDLEQNLNALRAGSITAEDFYREVQINLRGVSRKVGRMLRTPSWYSREDIEQEVALSVWLRAWDYDQGQGPTVLGYVLWNAKRAGMKGANGARHGGHRPHRGENLPPAVQELPSSDQIDGQRDDEDGRRPRQPHTEATQETGIIRREEELARRQDALTRCLAVCSTTREAAIMATVVAEGGVGPAAEALWANGSPPARLCIRSRRHAEELVWTTLERVASRLLEANEAA